MMKGFLLLLLFLTMQIEGQNSSDSSTSLSLYSKSLNENDSFQNSGHILPHLFKKKRVKKIQPFKIKSNSSSYENDYNENFVRLIENFLLKHLKKIIKQQKQSLVLLSENSTENYQDNDSNLNNEEIAYKYFQGLKNKYTQMQTDLTKLTTQANPINNSTNVDISFTIHNKFRNCNLNSSKNETKQAIVKCETFKKENRNQIEVIKINKPAKIQKVNLFISSSTRAYLPSEKTYNDLKQVVVFYKKNFSYFVSALIILSTISVVLLIITFTCCAIVCKQRSSLNAYNDNEFFTYYNRNLPIVASVSSLSLSANANERIDRITDKNVSSNQMIYDVNGTGSKEALINQKKRLFKFAFLFLFQICYFQFFKLRMKF